MLLLPVPRTIYTSKPEWYGIDDITRGMGWPPTTQYAVTMPGEMYANFGFLGAPLIALFGMIFGAFYRKRLDPRFLFVYAMILLPSMFVTFWMSFTGFMNVIFKVPIYLLLVWLVIKPIKEGSVGPVPADLEKISSLTQQSS